MFSGEESIKGDLRHVKVYLLLITEKSIPNDVFPDPL
ncbi:MAG: hypothetical protein ACI96M_002395 [Candidatus Azotimanducaceae bacterium]|jgi:hypothetical protein